MSVTRTLKPARWVCRVCSAKGHTTSPLRQARWASTASQQPAGVRQWSTPLAKTIAEAIQTTGPISLAQYMRQCLTSPEGGYYTRQTNLKDDGDQFGKKGDFITSPEISQAFGELLGIWFMTEWMSQGRPTHGVDLIEVGPGRGTLMDDMLRAIRNFRAFTGAIECVYMVEASPGLRGKQRQLLCGENSTWEETAIGWRCSKSKYGNIPVVWCEDIRFVPHTPDRVPFIVAHEFFDALPIHAFRSVPPAPNNSNEDESKTKASNTIIGLDGKPVALHQPQAQETMKKSSSAASRAAKSHQWRELLVDVCPPAQDHKTAHKPYSNVSNSEPADFQLVQARASNPASLLLPEISSRYQALKSMTDAVIEVSPESHSYAGEFARRIGGGGGGGGGTSNINTANPAASTNAPGSSPAAAIPKPRPSGAALILDYGTQSTVPTSTLRGIRAHELVSPFAAPGLVDLSADVDFTALAEAAIDASPGVEVHGPVEQGDFLQALGIRERAAELQKKAGGGGGGGGGGNGTAEASGPGSEDGEAAAKRIATAVARLIEKGGGGMGRIYKALAIVPENGGRRRPVGFGGQVGQ